MSHHFDWRILDRHLAGESSPDDEAALEQWLAADPRNAELLNAARAAARAPGERDGARWDVERAWSRVAARMHDAPDPTIVPLHGRRGGADRERARRAQRVVGALAGLLVAAGVVAVVWERSAGHTDLRDAAARHEVVAAAAQQTQVTLGDGTRVVLNAGSRLRYDGDFGRGARDVELEGEGYFDVVHDESRPFRVHARGVVAQDVGTRFVVRAYPEQRAIDVVVTHGSVALRHERVAVAPTLLAAGQHGRIEPSGAVTVADDRDVERWLEWTRGGIVLEGTTLADAALEIGRRFDVNVEVPDDALARRRVSARFHGEPLPRVLDALALALGARWSRQGDHIVFARAD